MPQHGTRFRGNLLPRHEIRMMLHHGRENFVTRLEVGFAPTARHGIDRGCRALREDDFLRLAGIDELPDLFAGLLILLGTALAESMNSAMHVGVVVLVDAGDSIDHLPGPLRAGGVVEKHERMTVEHVAVENRKVFAKRCRQQRSFVDGGQTAHEDLPPSTGEWTADCNTFHESRQHFWRFGVSRGP